MTDKEWAAYIDAVFDEARRNTPPFAMPEQPPREAVAQLHEQIKKTHDFAYRLMITRAETLRAAGFTLPERHPIA